IEQRPAATAGEWLIGGRSFTANASTELDTDDGPLTVGSCASVDYEGNLALEIESEELYACNTGGDDSRDDDDDSANDDDDSRDDDDDFYGIIEQRPAATAGEWLIGGRSFTANASTELDTDDGPLTVGSCASVDYEGNLALEIESEELYACSTGEIEHTVYGVVEIIPTNPQDGIWTISGIAYRSTSESDLDDIDDDDMITVGSCVEIEYYTLSGTNIIIELDDADDRICNGTPMTYRSGLVYNNISSLPDTAGLLGNWEIGDLDFTATETTVFGEPLDTFTRDVCVRAWFMVAPGGERTLTEVKQIAAAFCHSDDDNIGDIYGTIDVLPATFPITRTGIWNISGIDYTVTADTELDQEYGIFAIGAFVEVEYVLVDGMRVATDIETHVAPGKGRNRAAGILEQRPDDDLGTWSIAGVNYTSDPTIDVDLDDNNDRISLAAVGSPVIVNYYTAPDGSRMITNVRSNNSLFLPIVVR
ncbi:MAG: hypothetical protein HC837_18955, partial [Chloroflexaceae bacterium]|nr:hypothetical protein [Chloroflexaceae bacterium]